MPYRVYILECSDGTYYIGSAADVEQRLWQHQQGLSPTAYTHSRRPVKLVWYSQEVNRYSEALRFERQIKGWSRAKKEALIRGDFDAVHEIVRNEKEESGINIRAERRDGVLLSRSRSAEEWISHSPALRLRRTKERAAPLTCACATGAGRTKNVR